jgi:stage II sporulation protein R
VNSAFVIKDSSRLVNAYKNDNLIRLHVIANSNSPEDQYLKRKVKNDVVKYIAAQSDSSNYDKSILIKNKKKIKEVINDILKTNNVNYSVKITSGNYNFPRRTYNNYTLPPGKYKALKIILGKGQGSNWWCVLLPPLCIENNINKSKDNKSEIEFRLKLAEFFDLDKVRGYAKITPSRVNVNDIKPVISR